MVKIRKNLLNFLENFVNRKFTNCHKCYILSFTYFSQSISKFRNKMSFTNFLPGQPCIFYTLHLSFTNKLWEISEHEHFPCLFTTSKCSTSLNLRLIVLLNVTVFYIKLWLKRFDISLQFTAVLTNWWELFV